MPTGAGLDAQFGMVAESTYGTLVTVTRFLEFSAESLKFEPTWLEPTGLRPGVKYKRVARVKQSRKMVNGDLTLEWATKGLGLLVKHMLGSPVTVPTVIVAGAYRQPHVPGDFRTLSTTMQVGRPEPSTGTVRPHTLGGCKIPSWEFSCKDNEIPTLKVTIDGRSEATATALATATYLTGATVFDFSQATLKLGGTPTTSAGLTTVAGGVAVATVVREIGFKGEAPMATERFGLGNAGLKSEPLENDTPTVTGSLAAEFNKTELYDVYQANTTTCLEFTLTGGQIAATGEFFMLKFICPAIKLKSAAPSVSGPDIVAMSTEFEGYSDETTNPVIQVLIQSDESVL